MVAGSARRRRPYAGAMPEPGERLSVASARVLAIRSRRDGGWCAGVLAVEQGPERWRGQHLSVAGLLPDAEEGRYYSCELAYAPHPTFGPQWKVERAVPTTPMTPAGLVAYLEETIPGIGPRRAAALVERFGTELPQVLDGDDAAGRIRGIATISAGVAEGLVATWRQARDDRRLSLTLLDAGWSMAQIARARDRFGLGVGQVLAEDPYRLMAVRGIGFTQADAVAVKTGLAGDHPGRLAAAAAHILMREAGEGHCWLELPALVARTAELLGLEAAAVGGLLPGLLGAAERPGEALVACDGQQRCWLRHLLLAHRRVVQEGVRRIAVPRALGPAHQALAARDGLVLTPEQQAAVAGVVGHSLVVLTGGPGTGKTTVVRAILDACNERMHLPRIRLAAPTGKAAKRLADSTGQEASTIHRLLEWGDEGPRRTADNPVEADLVVVDEASMLDIELAAALLAGLPPTCRLVLVGDVDQLPPVGPGQVLADLITGGAPTFRLTAVHRQAGGSLILAAAHAVNHGQMPQSGRDFARDDLFVIAQPDAGLLVERVVRMVAETITAQRGIAAADIRVLVPVNKGDCGVDAFNQRLRDRLNPADPDKPELGAGAERLRVGDRLVWLSNSTEHALVNGQELVLAGVERDAGGQHALLAAEDGRRIRLPAHALDVRLAYAFSIHKSQGSEYPAVVVVLHPSAWRLLERRLLYTAITRARRLCLLVGDPRALARAVANVESRERRSGLAADLRAGLDAG
jgi:exodeoxyribonuclease V alpha subunit